MPRSVFMGRPLPGPGEQLFLEEDTAAVIALAEEERDTCPSCGMLKSWCRDPANQFAFEPHEDTCFATWRLAQHRNSEKWQKKNDDTRQATQLSVRFRENHEPKFDAGLNLD